MNKMIKYYWTPGIFGMISCALLVLSRYLSSSESAALQALNNVVTVAVLAFCIHMVRRTASLKGIHVWNNRNLIVLFAIPVTLLLVTAFQFMLKDSSVFRILMSGDVAKVVLTLLSFPMFFLHYFLYMAQGISSKQSRVGCALLSAVCAVFVLLRLMSTVFFPLLLNGGVNVPSWMITVAAGNAYVSLALYIVDFFGFLYMTRLLHNNLLADEMLINGDDES